MATLKDIAKAAGVSISTASRALKNSASISAETRKTVQEVAYKVNYRSKRIASSEVITQKSVIAVIVPHISNPYYSTLVSGIQDAAVMQQYSIMLFSTERDSASEKKAVDMILSMDVAGVIIAPPETEQTNCEKLHEAQLPVVYAGYRPSSCEFPYSAVVPDDYTGAILATEYLVCCGMKSILLFTGPSETHSAHNRVNGYLEVIRRSNLAPNIFSGPFTYHAGYQMALDLFGKSGVSPAEAVIAGADSQAIGIMHALEKNNLKVPGNVSLISFEDTFMTGLCSPELTAVSLPIYRMGTKSVSVLLNRIEEGSSSGEIELVKPSLIKRKSCRGKNVHI